MTRSMTRRRSFRHGQAPRGGRVVPAGDWPPRTARESCIATSSRTRSDRCRRRGTRHRFRAGPRPRRGPSAGAVRPHRHLDPRDGGHAGLHGARSASRKLGRWPLRRVLVLRHRLGGAVRRPPRARRSGGSDTASPSCPRRAESPRARVAARSRREAGGPPGRHGRDAGGLGDRLPPARTSPEAVAAAPSQPPEPDESLEPFAPGPAAPSRWSASLAQPRRASMAGASA